MGKFNRANLTGRSLVLFKSFLNKSISGLYLASITFKLPAIRIASIKDNDIVYNLLEVLLRKYLITHTAVTIKVMTTQTFDDAICDIKEAMVLTLVPK